jgi:hypothetical protein
VSLFVVVAGANAAMGLPSGVNPRWSLVSTGVERGAAALAEAEQDLY